jgi:hypothetical protein
MGAAQTLCISPESGRLLKLDISFAHEVIPGSLPA